MRRTAFLVSVLLCAFVLPQSAVAARKLFVRDVVLSGSCVQEVSVNALRAQLAQEMPRDILAHRGLAYEDLSPYLDAGKWNSESFTVREARNIMKRVRQFDMQMMLWLEVSCVPGPDNRHAYVLTGHLMDLDRMDQILSCMDAEARDQRRVCHGSGDVFDAVTFAHAEMDSFAGFVSALRHVLARLLRIPEIEVRLDLAAEVFNPGQIINLRFSVRRNDANHSVPIRYLQQIIRLPADQREQICRSPATYWEQHACADSNGPVGCPDAVPFFVVPVRGQATTPEGGAAITLRAPSHDDDYLIRAEALAREGDGEIRSTPDYRCIQIRARKFQVGLGLRLGTPVPNEFDNGITVGPLVFGVDVFLGYSAIPSRSNLPGIGLAAVLGATYAGGGTCIASPTGGDCYSRFSRSFTTEVRGQIQVDILRYRQVAFRGIGDLGIGMESVSTIGSYFDDGIHALLLGGIGLSGSGHFGLSPRWDLGWTLGVMYQWRFRITQGIPTPETIEFPSDTGMSQKASLVLGQGVPPLWQPLWFTLGLSFASPLKAR